MVRFPGPERIIHTQLAKLARDVSFTQSENGLVKVAHAQSVANFFSTNVVVIITVPGREQQTMVGRDDITQAALASLRTIASLDVKFPDIVVTLAPGRNAATVDVTVEAMVSGESDLIVQEMKFTFEKAGGRWLINRVETVRTLS